MAAVGVGAELDFVHRDKFDLAVERHRLHGAGEPFGVGRDDLFLAGDESDVFGALAGHHAVVVLARRQPRREADDAGGLAKHSLHGKVRLAGVRRTEDGLHAGRETGVQPCMDRMFVRRGAECKGFRGLLGLAAISPGALTAIVHLDPMVRRIAAGKLQQTHVRRLSREIPATPRVRYPLSARLTDAGSRSMTVR